MSEKIFNQGTPEQVKKAEEENLTDDQKKQSESRTKHLLNVQDSRLGRAAESSVDPEGLEEGCRTLREYLEKQKGTYETARINISGLGTDQSSINLYFYDKGRKLLNRIDIRKFMPDHKNWYFANTRFSKNSGVVIGIASKLEELLKEYNIEHEK